MNYIRQAGQFYSFVANDFIAGSDQGIVTDMTLGFRFPKRIGAVVLEAQNLFDEQFRLQEINPQNPSIARRRIVLGKLYWNF